MLRINTVRAAETTKMIPMIASWQMRSSRNRPIDSRIAPNRAKSRDMP